MPSRLPGDLLSGKIEVHVRVNSARNVRLHIIPVSPLRVVQRKAAVDDRPVRSIEVKTQF
jgi:hypothetical protein